MSHPDLATVYRARGFCLRMCGDLKAAAEDFDAAAALGSTAFERSTAAQARPAWTRAASYPLAVYITSERMDGTARRCDRASEGSI